MNRSLAFRAKLTHGDGDAGLFCQSAFFEVFNGERNEVKLHVRRFQLCTGAQEYENR